jgi:hypothetical protein
MFCNTPGGSLSCLAPQELQGVGVQERSTPPDRMPNGSGFTLGKGEVEFSLVFDLPPEVTPRCLYYYGSWPSTYPVPYKMILPNE